MSAPAGSAPWALLRRLAATVKLLLLVSVLALGGGFVLFVDALNRPEPRRLPHAEGIVALTGGAERISEALDLLLAGQGDRLLISGVNPSTSAGDLTRTAPGARRLLTCCIELGYAAGNTIGNALETRLWVRRHNIRSLIVVTSDYHMPRALAEIGAAAPGVDLVPYPVSSGRPEGLWWEDGGRLRLALVEYLKYLVVVARTHLDPAGPYEESAALMPHTRRASSRAAVALPPTPGSSKSHEGSDARADEIEEQQFRDAFRDADHGGEERGRHHGGEPPDHAVLPCEEARCPGRVGRVPPRSTTGSPWPAAAGGTLAVMVTARSSSSGDDRRAWARGG